MPRLPKYVSSTLRVTIPQAVWAVATIRKGEFIMYIIVKVTIPQAVWAVATQWSGRSSSSFGALQYRKRYELLQRVCDECVSAHICGYNTASGMSCCNLFNRIIFRKMYCYNTASGMSCCNKNQKKFKWQFVLSLLQYRKRYELLQRETCFSFEIDKKGIVTIPQAVWAVATLVWTLMLMLWAWYCYNTASGMSCCNSKRDYHPFGASSWYQVTIPQAVWAVATE